MVSEWKSLYKALRESWASVYSIWFAVIGSKCARIGRRGFPFWRISSSGHTKLAGWLVGYCHFGQIDRIFLSHSHRCLFDFDFASESKNGAL